MILQYNYKIKHLWILLFVSCYMYLFLDIFVICLQGVNVCFLCFVKEQENLNYPSSCVCVCVCVCILVAQSCPTVCDSMDCSPPGSPVHGILQARILEWVAISFCKWSSWPRDITKVSLIAGRFFTIWATGKVLLSQSCSTLCDTINCSLPISSVHGIFQARILEWVASSFSRASSRPRDQTGVPHIYRQMHYHLSHQGSPFS